ncbi:MAG: FAD:protein FMN transferase [Acidobacteria bacterium]|jgi:thiamine biosynthesis lipoprotein|nr:MAG: FAD:protein FMN transferase [Acidobacteriota bacterium]
MKTFLGLLFLGSSVLAQERLFHLMGTYAVLELPKDKEYEAYRYMRSLEEKLSDYMDSSEISRINALAGKSCAKVSKETIGVIKKALKVSSFTGGAFDITVGSYTINYGRKGILSEEGAKALIDYRKVRVEKDRVCLKEEGMALDLGGIGKGYAVQKAYEHLRTSWGFISIAGDIKVWGHRRLLGIFNPINNSLLAQGHNSRDLCLSTGGNYLRRHILGKENNLIQVTVAHKDCALADAIETALLAMDDKEREAFLMKNPSVGVMLLFKDGSLYVNNAFVSYFEGLLFFFPNK